MNRSENLYMAETGTSVGRFVADFSAVVKANQFVINNPASMDMKATFHEHGGEVPAEFELHMIQICKPAKTDKSLTTKPERAILMPKFIHVFSKDDRTHIRYMRYSPEQTAAIVADDPQFPRSLTQTFDRICTMIDKAK